MCQFQFTIEEMAAALKISKRTLIRKIKVKTLWEDGAASGLNSTSARAPKLGPILRVETGQYQKSGASASAQHHPNDER
jgi:hypothetical protein